MTAVAVPLGLSFHEASLPDEVQAAPIIVVSFCCLQRGESS